MSGYCSDCGNQHCICGKFPDKKVKLSVFKQGVVKEMRDLANEWISVKDKLPEDNQIVVFIIDKKTEYYGGSVCAGRFRYFDYKDGSEKSPEFSTWGLGGLTASHWMTIPELPKDKE